MTQIPERPADPTLVLSAADITRFVSKIGVPNEQGCRLWQDRPNAQGYGAFSFQRTMSTTHRLAYRLWNGPIPPRKLVRHLCNNRMCVSPQHLRTGSHLDNAKDAQAAGTFKGRQRMADVKLTAKDAEAIRLCVRGGTFNREEAVAMCGVSRQTIVAIVNGTWRPVKTPEQTGTALPWLHDLLEGRRAPEDAPAEPLA